MANFSCWFEDITDTSAHFYGEVTGASAFTGTRYVQLTINSRTYQISGTNYNGGVETDFSRTITGLSPNTRYSWTAKLGFRGTGDTSITWLDDYTDSGSIRTEAPKVTVTPWSWTASNGSASATKTRNAYNILQGTRTADDFSCQVWNDLVDKVAEVRDAIGWGWQSSGTITTASACKVNEGDTLSVRKYNALKVNIGSLYSTGIYDAEAEDEFTGYHIIHLTDCLNNYINSL